LLAKRLGLLHDVLPAAATIGFLVDPTFVGKELQTRDLQEAARTLGLQVQVVNAGTEAEIDAAFANLTKLQVGAVVLGAGTLFTRQTQQVVTLAARHALPTFYQYREYVAAGGLISYGASLADSYRQTGVYTGRILKGEKPADLPVLQPTKFELVINLKTAKALGLTIPPGVLAIADEVIE
jgi:putative tryptophan/tyrosine transport system substrate-binding protein